jgi:hypothetical protein
MGDEIKAKQNENKEQITWRRLPSFSSIDVLPESKVSAWPSFPLKSELSGLLAEISSNISGFRSHLDNTKFYGHR